MIALPPKTNPAAVASPRLQSKTKKLDTPTVVLRSPTVASTVVKS